MNEKEKTNYDPSEECGCHNCGNFDECCKEEGNGALEDGWCEEWKCEGEKK